MSSPSEIPIKQKIANFLFSLEKSMSLPIKSAIILNKRFSYFRGKDFIKLVQENRHRFIKQLTSFNISLTSTDNKEILSSITTLLTQNSLIFPAFKHSSDKLKYPSKLEVDSSELSSKFQIEDGKFYCINHEVPIKQNSIIYLLLVITIIISFTLFPLWPLNMKLSIWWILLFIIILLILLIVLRIILFFIGCFFGYDIMLFPNILTDEVGIYKSFFPIVGYAKQDDFEDQFYFRLICIGFLILSSLLTYFFSDYIYDILNFIFDSFSHISQWGTDKLTNYHNDRLNSGSSVLSRHEEYMKKIDV